MEKKGTKTKPGRARIESDSNYKMDSNPENKNADAKHTSSALEGPSLGVFSDSDRTGVLYFNPFYVENSKEVSSAETLSPSSSSSLAFQTLLEHHKRIVAISLSAIFCLLFVILPIMALPDDSPGSSDKQDVAMETKQERMKNLHFKGKHFLLLFATGIIQPYFLFFGLMKENVRQNVKLKKLWNVGNFLIFVYIIVISAWNQKREHKEMISSLNRKINNGNCTLLKNIPETYSKYMGSNEIFVMPDNDYPLVFKYKEDSLAMLHFAETMINDYYRDTDSNCTNSAFLFLFSVFAVCDKSCKEPAYVCQEVCNMECLSSIKKKNVEITETFDLESLWKDKKSFIMSLVQFHGDAAEKQEWMRQGLFRLINMFMSRMHSFYNNKEKPVCRDKSYIDSHPGSSCLFTNGTTYDFAKFQQDRESPRCEVASTQNERGINGERETDSKFSLSNMIILSYYTHALIVLFVWCRTANETVSMCLFDLNAQAKVTIALLGLVALALGGLAFQFVVVLVEKHFVLSGGIERGFSLFTLYMIVATTIFITMTFGTRLVLFASFGHGTNIDRESKVNEKKNTGIQLLKELTQKYRTHTSPRGGKWFFGKLILWEFFEVAVQTANLYTFASTREQDYILLSSCLLFINSTAVLAIMYRRFQLKKTSTHRKLNGAILFLDTIIDALFYVLNLYFLSANDLYRNPWIGSFSVCWPLFCMVLRLNSIARLLSFRYTGDKAKALHLPKLSSCAHKQNNSELSLLATLTILFLYQAVQFGVLQYRIMGINAKCSAELGTKLWKGASPKYTFSNGLFQSPTCEYGQIKFILAPNSNINQISGTIAKCTGLLELDLHGNDLKYLPLELLEMSKIDAVNLEGNPVFSSLSIHNASMSSKNIPIFILQHLNASLLFLDLSHNDIELLQPDVGAFQNLKVLRLNNNKIDQKGIPWEITKLNSTLEEFSVDGNQVSSVLNWANQQGFRGKENHLDNAIAFLEQFMKGTLRLLNMSKNDGFTRKHFDKITNRFPALESLDLSNCDIISDVVEPLQLSLASSMKKLLYLNLDGNTKVKAISPEDVEEIEIRLRKSRSAVFSVRNTGLKYFKHSNPDATDDGGRDLRFNFPALFLSQLRDSLVTIHIESFGTNNFDFADLCNFTILNSIYVQVFPSTLGSKALHIPSCLKRLQCLQYFVVKAPLNNTNLARNAEALSNAFEVRLYSTSYTGSYNELIALPDFPNGIVPNRAEWYNFLPRQLPNYVSKHLYILLRRSNINYTIPSKWSTINRLWLEIPTLSGPVSGLKIKRVAVLGGTSLTGPLFSLGPNFTCAELPYYKGNFPLIWGLTCLNLTSQASNRTFIREELFLPIRDSDTKSITNLYKCPTLTSSMYCFSINRTVRPLVGSGIGYFLDYYQEDNGDHMDRQQQECYEESYLKRYEGRCTCAKTLYSTNNCLPAESDSKINDSRTEQCNQH
jgi:hypothetical protein